jgi:integrase
VRAAAEKMLREELGRAHRGEPVLPDPRRILVDTLLDGLLTEYRANRRRSLDRAELSCRHLLRFFSGRLASAVTGADVVKYADLRLAEKAAPASVNRELSALRRAYRIAYRQNVLAAVPPVTTLREDNTRTGFFERDQLEAVCRHLDAPERAAVRFMFLTGWRSRSEVFPLTWAQVDWAGGFVRLEPGAAKNREGRAFPITPELRTVLEERRAETDRVQRATGRIIRSVFHRNGEPIKYMDKSWETACRKAGVPGRILHDFRRTAVRNLERAGVSRSVAMQMTGHRTESVYRRYAIVVESDIREAGAKLAALTSTTTGPGPRMVTVSARGGDNGPS